MSLVNHKKTQTIRDRKETFLDENVVSQPFWGDQEYVNFISIQTVLDARPIRVVR